MKQHQTVGLARPGFTGTAVNRRVNVCLLAVLRIAVCALATQCLTLALVRAADALPVKEPSTQTIPPQKPAYTPKGYQMERYKAFARQTEMPAILVSNTNTLELGGTIKIDLNRQAQLSIQEKEALAGQFGVPAGVIAKVIARATNNPPPGAAQLAQDIRTAVVDYKFLQGEWKRYNPPAESQQIKAEALQALQGGDFSKAWELYDGLQRPAPPGNLRAVARP